MTFTTLTVWFASRVEELGEAVALVVRNDPGNLAQEWLHRRIASSLWHRRESIVARCLVIAAWVALASWQLEGVSLAGRVEAIVSTLAGVTGIALASIYEWRVSRSLIIDSRQA